MDTLDNENRRAIYDYIVAFREERGYAPTFEEIRAGLDISSLAVVSHHIVVLARDGYVTMEAGKARTLVPHDNPQS